MSHMLFAVLFIVVCLVEDTNEVSRSLQKQVLTCLLYPFEFKAGAGFIEFKYRLFMA
jgi:hypothetical protein